jgi:hypothetical protein
MHVSGSWKTYYPRPAIFMLKRIHDFFSISAVAARRPKKWAEALCVECSLLSRHPRVPPWGEGGGHPYRPLEPLMAAAMPFQALRDMWLNSLILYSIFYSGTTSITTISGLQRNRSRGAKPRSMPIPRETTRWRSSASLVSPPVQAWGTFVMVIRGPTNGSRT